MRPSRYFMHHLCTLQQSLTKDSRAGSEGSNYHVSKLHVSPYTAYSVAHWHLQTWKAPVCRCLTNRLAGVTRRERQKSFQLESFTVSSEFYRLSSPWTELNMCLFASTFHARPQNPPAPRAKLFSALYLTPCSTPPTRRSRSNSQRLVKVGLPEMWKSVMGDSSFGLSPGKAKGLEKKG